MNTQLISGLAVERARVAVRARLVALLGPGTVAAGVIWAIIQPYRLTLLHPRGQSFWWLAIEPPLLVVLAGTVFSLFVARGLIADLEEARAAA